MQYVVVTSKGLESFAKIAYKKIFNVKRIPKGSIVVISKGIYRYSKNRHGRHKKVDLEDPFDDIYALRNEDKTYKALEAFTEEDEVHYFSDVDFGYSQMILWEIHHAFKIPLNRLAAVQKLPYYNNETNTMLLKDVYKPYSIKEFEPEMIRKMVAISVLKLALYHYAQRYIYGPPFNLSTFIYIKMHHELPPDTKNRFRLIHDYTEDFDISSPPLKKSYNAASSLIARRLYQTMSEDIKGFKAFTFLDSLKELINQFSTREINYDDYKETIKKIFNIEGDIL